MENLMARRETGWVRAGVAALAGGLLLGGCATADRDRAAEIEPLLIAAGFQKRVADTPQKLAHLQQLEPLKLIPHARQTSVYYVYADPNGCRCAYVGNEMAFEQYQGLVLKQTVSEAKVSVTQVDEDSMMSWGSWGPGFWPR
jgi:hypothetical protein